MGRSYLAKLCSLTLNLLLRRFTASSPNPRRRSVDLSSTVVSLSAELLDPNCDSSYSIRVLLDYNVDPKPPRRTSTMDNQLIAFTWCIASHNKSASNSGTDTLIAEQASQKMPIVSIDAGFTTLVSASRPFSQVSISFNPQVFGKHVYTRHFFSRGHQRSFENDRIPNCQELTHLTYAFNRAIASPSAKITGIAVSL